MTMTGPVPPALLDDLASSRTGELLTDELAARWPLDSDELSSIARYALLPAGKFLRPVMTMIAAEAVGGQPIEVLPAALAMEYLHVATLTHDDIIDGDTLRRGRPTVHVAHGLAHAIVAGDHLIFAAFTGIAECRAAGLRDPAVVESVAVLAEAGSDLCRGQMLEARLVGDITAEPAAYLEMARLKTGALFRAVCQIGALLAGADSDQAAALGRYGSDLGVAFQIRDDLILFADPGVSDKPIGSDLANGRPTLPVLMAYQTSDADTRLAMGAALTRRSAEPAEFEEFRSLLMATGAMQGCQDHAEEYGRRALAELSRLRPSHSVDLLTGIVRWAVTTRP
ncbi:MAG TPA: polyprenyl synthetase family protein [Jatrophihabitans sp.]|jgi:geranylgeranyl diphosphate synthase type I|uniref:polyprenyl synthetase family protein n=1 Tax=Jatrophihabitans sp. TaxID=1932789 RepID=UPI002EDD6CBF